ncbi:MAG: hypothetical protein HYV28_06860 [Ignavibacteriales bacterium]|nr:hypothetical protein [Ignavibacteriales bacterium]
MKYFYHIFFFLIIFLFSSCEVTEPERAYNKDADKTVTGALTASSFDTSKIYQSPMTINFRLDSLNFKIDKINIFIDEQNPITMGSNSNIFSYTIYPSQLASGRHTAVISVVPEKFGLYTANGVGVLNYGFPFYTYAWPDLGISITKIDTAGKPTISWSECRDYYFKGYKIIRQTLLGTDTVATISERTKTTYRDSTCPELYGFNAFNYKIVAYNQFTSYVTSVKTVSYFSGLTKLPFTASLRPLEFLPCPDGSLIYCVSNSFVHANIKTNTILSTVYSEEGLNLIFNRNKNKLFFSGYHLNLPYIFDYNGTLSNCRGVNLGSNIMNGNGIIELAPDILFLPYTEYTTSSGLVEKFIVFFDPNTNKIIKKFKSNFSVSQYFASQKNWEVFTSKSNNDTLFVIDALDTANISLKTVGKVGQFINLKSLQSGEILIQKKNSISVHDGQLKVLRSITFPEDIFRMTVNNDIIAVVTRNAVSGVNTIWVYELATLQLRKKIMLSNTIYEIILFENSEIVFYIYGSNYNTYFKL